jgi:polyisoprenyl-teichoic acid--peptidoglycan teichoic acid transferase
MTEQPERAGRGLFKRFLVGAFVIMAAAGSATGIAAFEEVDRVVDAFKHGGKLDLGDELAEAEPGKPQTIMLIGSDKRAKGARDAEDGFGRSDTVILVRLDPSKRATAIMSLPRDLKVEIPGVGTDKLNAAYTAGGAKLTLRTVKQFTGLSINHVINVDFGGFREGVNEIGCVYIDIDRRYFNDNSNPADQYATIDVRQGYQKLCGQDALDYVRYRHEDNDLVRAARQQEFLREAKQQVGVNRLLEDRGDLYEIFAEYTSSDIRSRSSVLRLLRLVIASAEHPVREVHFEGRIGPSYVTASQPRVQKLVDEFLGVRDTKGPRGEQPETPRERSSRRRSSRRDGLEDARGEGRDQALQAVSGGLRGLPIFYPRQRTAGSIFSGAPRVYRIRDEDDDLHRAYRMVLARPTPGGFTEYYGIQGTTWKSPPILEDASEEREIGGRKYGLHFDGDRLRLVAWRTGDGVYWVSNTLLQTLSEAQMLAIARSARSL